VDTCGLLDVQSTSCHVIKRQTLHKQFQIDYLPLQIKIKSLSLSNGQAEQRKCGGCIANPPNRGEWNVLINFESGLGWAAFRLVLFG